VDLGKEGGVPVETLTSPLTKEECQSTLKTAWKAYRTTQHQAIKHREGILIH